MKEIWKDVIGWEKLYQVSNLGRARSKEKKCWNGNGFFTMESKILIQHFGGSGYLYVGFHNNGINKHLVVHRIVAQHFIENPNNKPTVNHIDGDKTNNTVSNLEWLTRSENTQHAIRTGLMDYGKKVIQYDLNMNKIAEYESCKEAMRKTGVRNYEIGAVCNGKRKTAHGYIWKFKKSI